MGKPIRKRPQLYRTALIRPENRHRALKILTGVANLSMKEAEEVLRAERPVPPKVRRQLSRL